MVLAGKNHRIPSPPKNDHCSPLGLDGIGWDEWLSDVIGLLRAPLVLIIITGKWGSHLHSTNPTSSGYQVNLFRFCKFWADANSNPCPGRLLLWKTQSVVAPPFFYVLVGERGKLKTLKDFLFPKVNHSVHPNVQQMSQVI